MKTKEVIYRYKEEALNAKTIKDLKEFTPIIDFYKSFFSPELKAHNNVQTVDSIKKAPVQKPDFI